MNRVYAMIVISLFTVLIPVAALAQNENTSGDDYKAWMKQVDQSNGKLRKDLKAKQGDAAVDDATKIAGSLAQMEDFWQKRNAADAVKFAGDAAAGFKRVSDLASAGKFDEAAAELKSTQATCAGCHKAHRSMTIHGAEIK
jgi:cytochrome c556